MPLSGWVPPVRPNHNRPDRVSPRMTRRSLIRLIVMALLLGVALAAGAWWTLAVLGDMLWSVAPVMHLPHTGP
ncbi:hypothetical protein GCM10017600_71520 [Streptosporangium carneum]|uniref:Uncharacterized protein n=1 Tax=Streptosporangium carneum TaxID=47481 RepID=A0A9W6I7Y4_9ACTN|nr:hypothetical protein GCM10017600_71520 [Streptosporangium carneum]